MDRDKTLLVALGAIVLACLVAVWSENRQPAPNVTVQNIQGVLRYLSWVKSSSEDMLSAAKRKFGRRSLDRGETLYISLRAAQNSSIDEFKAALRLPSGSLSQDRIAALLWDVDQKARAFCAWYQDNMARRHEGICTSNAETIPFADYASALFELLKHIDEQDENRIRLFEGQLENCKIKSFSDIVAGSD